ncbi:uncharacterized protein LOC126912738 [Spodoptera frugiperda]|uniref:Uncharacterized protein LOC126912738 n=1 Tax=Spodoptera frugiperda TaxID=7108 RepID=A0A9R0EBY2_SPOFR|nr:uncharacterized protein LOC126912738 [Spodoptera frugiperda]
MADSCYVTCVLVIVCFSLPTFSEGNKCEFSEGIYKSSYIPDVKWPLLLQSGFVSLDVAIPMTWHLTEETKDQKLRIAHVCVQMKDGNEDTKDMSIKIVRTGRSARVRILLKKPSKTHRRLSIQLFGKPRT